MARPACLVPMFVLASAAAQAPDPARGSLPTPPTPGTPVLDRLVADLDAGDVGTRDTSTDELANRPELTLPQLEGALTRADLSPEQRARLLLAARERFLRSPRAAMGVQFAQGRPNPDAVIERVFDRFPASGVILPGDEIVRAGGHEAAELRDGRSMLRPVIISRDPGDTLPVRVKRNGQEIDLDVPLGRFDHLPQPTGLTAADLAGAWRVRSAVYATVCPGTAVVPGPPAEDWTSHNPSALGRESEWRALASTGQWPAFLPGGQNRGALDPAAVLAAARDEDPRGRDGLAAARALAAIRPGPAVTRPASGEIDGLITRLDELSAQRAELIARREKALAEARERGRDGDPGLRDYYRQTQMIDSRIRELKMRMEQLMQRPAPQRTTP